MFGCNRKLYCIFTVLAFFSFSAQASLYGNCVKGDKGKVEQVLLGVDNWDQYSIAFQLSTANGYKSISVKHWVSSYAGQGLYTLLSSAHITQKNIEIMNCSSDNQVLALKMSD